MAVLTATTLAPLNCTSSALRLQRKIDKIILDGLHGVCSTVTNCRESRRTLLWKSVGLGAVVSHANPSFSVPLLEIKVPEIISTVNQLSGESKPVIISLDEKEVIQGLKDVLIGMKVGGKRRALIPPSLGYITEGLKPIPEEFGPRRSLLSHAKEPLVFEVQLLKRL